MRDPEIECIVQRRADDERVPFHSLMPNRMHNILLVASLYDAYTFEEDGHIGELLFAEYLELNLRYAPRVKRASTMADAIQLLQDRRFDMVISMPRIGEEGLEDLAAALQEHAPDVPLVALAYNTRELQQLQRAKIVGLRRIFVWQGDQRLFTAMIKSIEDEANAEHDVAVAGVQVIILVEDSIRFYSSYLPMLYTELVRQTQLLMSETANRMQKLLRMRARPKLLLATSWEEGMGLFDKYKDHVLGVITDIAFPRNGRRDPEAGHLLAAAVKSAVPDLAVLLQSTEASNRERAETAGVRFIDKRSLNLLAEVRGFMQDSMGFGDFVFRTRSGEEVARARNLKEMAQLITEVQVEVLLHHARSNHFSTWLMARTEFALAHAIRPRQVEEFEDADAVRGYLHEWFRTRESRVHAGMVTEFMRDQDLETAHMFVRIGEGSLGGKGRGLAFMNSLFTRFAIDGHIPEVSISVPPTAILATGIFDAFMEGDGLSQLALHEHDDRVIADAFMAARFPDEAVRDLKAFLQDVHFPLAVRSSSLLEDASSQPFAGVYRTYMIPNNDPDLEGRLWELLTAIKLIYASTYYADAKAYIESTPNRLEEEKMAVVIQEVVGRRHEDLVY
ncbi:MAG: PEP/pyruvate-binding domain-containing protein, partial [Pseudomonadota bacterium]